MGVETVAVYSDADRDALHVRNAMEAVHIGPAPSSESYLIGERILAAARSTGADAIHPGYGFLSENAEFARAVAEAGIIWVGPSAEAIDAMGSKTESRLRMERAGVPVVPGTKEALQSVEQAESIAKELGFPVMLKASAGGGGKGMRQVDRVEDISSAFTAARSEAASSFGDDSVYIEKRIVGPRHVEVQVLADAHGNTLHLFERDCSVQRRNQKVVEETPCPVLKRLVRRCVRLRCRLQRLSIMSVQEQLSSSLALTVHSLEMNTRLQVEHPATEMVTGIIGLVSTVAGAGGEALPITQDDIKQHGHAIECRIYAEDPQTTGHHRLVHSWISRTRRTLGTGGCWCVCWC